MGEPKQSYSTNRVNGAAAMEIHRAILCGLVICSAWPRHEGYKSLNSLLFRKIVTGFNRKYISLYEAEISQDRSTINFTLNFSRNITVDLWLRAAIGQQVSKREDTYRDVFSYNVNLCQVMGRGKGNSLINYWMNNILRQSNMPRSCPMPEGNYYMRNIRSEKETIPRFIRSGSFRIDSNIYVRQWNNDNLTNTVFYIDIKMK